MLGRLVGWKVGRIPDITSLTWTYPLALIRGSGGFGVGLALLCVGCAAGSCLGVALGRGWVSFGLVLQGWALAGARPKLTQPQPKAAAKPAAHLAQTQPPKPTQSQP